MVEDDRTRSDKEIFIEAIKHVKKGEVLDIGAGNGEDSIFFAKKGYNVTAIDNDIQRTHDLRLLSKINNVRIKVLNKDVFELKTTKKFDIIICNNVFHLMNEENKTVVIEKMKRLTKIKGINIITGFTKENPPKNHLSLFKNNELKDRYQDWMILSYKEYCQPIKHGIVASPKGIVELIAKRI